MGAMQSFTSILPTLTSALGTVQTIAGTVNTVKSLAGSNDDLALDQLKQTQALQSQQQAESLELQKQNITLNAAENESDRKDALRRAVARQRASFGSSGVGASGGSSEAVLLGLVEESEEDRASREASDTLRLQAIDQDLSQNQALNLLQSTQLAERQSINNLF